MSSKKIKTEDEAVETVETTVEENSDTAVIEDVVTDEVAVITEKVIKKSEDKAKEVPVSVMYVGPSIANVVQSSTVFKGGILTSGVEKYVEGKPYMKKLFVPVSELSKAMKELNSDKSALSIIYNKIKNEI